MTIVTAARRRQADDLQALLDGDRASSPASAAGLADLVSLARALSPVEHAPDDAFRAALRDRLVTEAAARVPAPVVPAARARPSAPSRLRQLVATVAVASVVAGVGAAAASTRALPGDTLYGLKRQIEAGQLALARGDLGHGRELLEQADARLTEAERLTAGEDGSDPATRALVGQALREMAADVTAGAADLTEAYEETGNAQAMILLDRFVLDQRERLRDLMALLDPSLRPLARAIADQLAQLDAQATAVTGGTALPATALTADGDGWAVSRRLDASKAAAAGGAASSTAPVGGVLDAVGEVAGDTVGGGTVGGGTATGGSTGSGSGGLVGGVVGDLTGGSTSSSPDTPQLLPSSLPTVSVAPLPTSSPLVTDPVGAVTSAVPLPSSSVLPSVSLCVPVPPLTAC
ncbi:MAG: hypothetical protein QOD68_2771 [Actinomycetota bacterium]|jgi:hypothetical protein|nr:hypothetical protein [Actinomycetota bacterium]